MFKKIKTTVCCCILLLLIALSLMAGETGGVTNAIFQTKCLPAIHSNGALTFESANSGGLATDDFHISEYKPQELITH